MIVGTWEAPSVSDLAASVGRLAGGANGDLTLRVALGPPLDAWQTILGKYEDSKGLILCSPNTLLRHVPDERSMDAWDVAFPVGVYIPGGVDLNVMFVAPGKGAKALELLAKAKNRMPELADENGQVPPMAGLHAMLAPILRPPHIVERAGIKVGFVRAEDWAMWPFASDDAVESVLIRFDDPPRASFMAEWGQQNLGISDPDVIGEAA